MTRTKKQVICNLIDELAEHEAERCVAKGWNTGEPLSLLQVTAKLALIHSEISEAVEAFRKDAQDSHLPHRKGIEVELADAIIRILELAGSLRLSVGDALLEKDDYNDTREDHKPENRALPGGKRF